MLIGQRTILETSPAPGIHQHFIVFIIRWLEGNGNAIAECDIGSAQFFIGGAGCNLTRGGCLGQQFGSQGFFLVGSDRLAVGGNQSFEQATIVGQFTFYTAGRLYHGKSIVGTRHLRCQCIDLFQRNARQYLLQKTIAMLCTGNGGALQKIADVLPDQGTGL